MAANLGQMGLQVGTWIGYARGILGDQGGEMPVPSEGDVEHAGSLARRAGWAAGVADLLQEREQHVLAAPSGASPAAVSEVDAV